MKSYYQLVRHEGNDALFLAIEMSLISTLAGIPLHFHVEGVRGTGKTTILRAARQSLPDITQLSGCLYHCAPERPHCPLHSQLAESAAWETERRTMPFLEISHSAKLGTVVGSIDLAKLTDRNQPTAALLPGTVPQAHRGVVLVDEINRLAETAPDLADVFLSVMGTKPGRVQIEETGLPVVELPVNVSVWAASNPDEEPGPLEDVRRQLADRFDMVIPVRRPTDHRVVRSILGHGHNGPSPAAGAVCQLDRQILAAKAGRLAGVVLPDSIEDLIARIYIDYNLESLRAVEAWAHTSRLSALLSGRMEVIIDDLLKVAPLVLRHRLDTAVLSQVLRELAARQAAGSAEKKPAPDAKDPGHRDGPGGEIPRAAAGSGQDRDLAAPESAETPWNKLFSRLRDCFSLAPAGQDGPGRGAPGDRNRRLASRLSPASGPGGMGTQRYRADHPCRPGTATALTDPDLLPVNAPPLPARPLVSLAGAELVCPAEQR
ncbi:MAG: magnesium chelatase [Bacillota bacterium]